MPLAIINTLFFWKTNLYPLNRIPTSLTHPKLTERSSRFWEESSKKISWID